MAVELDHFMVPCRDKVTAARQLAELCAAPWAEARIGPFCAVYLNNGLTLDFDETSEPYPVSHYCFRVEQREFDAILSRLRAAGIPFRSTPHGPVDMAVNTQYGGSIVYWSEPGGHVWELLTVSYARRAKEARLSQVRPRRPTGLAFGLAGG